MMPKQPGLKTGVENGLPWCETRSGFAEPVAPVRTPSEYPRVTNQSCQLAIRKWRGGLGAEQTLI